jgi:hypothetical protein
MKFCVHFTLAFALLSTAFIQCRVRDVSVLSELSLREMRGGCNVNATKTCPDPSQIQCAGGDCEKDAKGFWKCSDRENHATIAGYQKCNGVAKGLEDCLDEEPIICTDRMPCDPDCIGVDPFPPYCYTVTSNYHDVDYAWPSTASGDDCDDNPPNG